MMRFEIKSYITGSILFSLETENIKLCVEAAVKQRADLQGADLQGADLQGADLQGADLQGADLRGADLRGADLRGAYLQGADLRGADLRDIKLDANTKWPWYQFPEGDLIGWKKCQEGIVKLWIP